MGIRNLLDSAIDQQPTHDQGDPPVGSWRCSLEQLATFVDERRGWD
jgi:hypothetical protein